jgi:uncharacterized membrane protein
MHDNSGYGSGHLSDAHPVLSYIEEPYGTRSVLESAPGCVMISAIAPYFASGNPAQIIALLVAAGCAIRLSMLPTLIISVATLGILQLVIS